MSIYRVIISKLNELIFSKSNNIFFFFLIISLHSFEPLKKKKKPFKNKYLYLLFLTVIVLVFKLYYLFHILK